jgi:hypothetical protein
MASEFAVYDPPEEGLPYLAVSVIGGATEAFPAKTRAEAEALLAQRKGIWEARRRFETKYGAKRDPASNAAKFQMTDVASTT